MAIWTLSHVDICLSYSLSLLVFRLKKMAEGLNIGENGDVVMTRPGEADVVKGSERKQRVCNRKCTDENHRCREEAVMEVSNQNSGRITPFERRFTRHCNAYKRCFNANQCEVTLFPRVLRFRSRSERGASTKCVECVALPVFASSTPHCTALLTPTLTTL